MRVHVHDELTLEPVGARLRQVRRRGFRPARGEDGAVHLVHGDEGGSHPCSGLEKAATVHPLFAAELVGHRQEPRFNFLLPAILRIGIELVARDYLGWNGRVVPDELGWHQFRELLVGQDTAHAGSSMSRKNSQARFTAVVPRVTIEVARYLGERVVREAIHPALAGLGGRDHGMVARSGVRAGVALGRVVAAERRAALLARPQVHPRRSNLDAVVALRLRRVLHAGDCADVIAGCLRHRSPPHATSSGRIFLRSSRSSRACTIWMSSSARLAPRTGAIKSRAFAFTPSVSSGFSFVPGAWRVK